MNLFYLFDAPVKQKFLSAAKNCLESLMATFFSSGAKPFQAVNV